MKTQHAKANAGRAKKFPDVLAASTRALLVALSLFVLTSTPLLAVDAVWLLSPGSGDWNTNTNWLPASAPIHPGDTAAFNKI
jgi:hypothetical protein